MSFRHLVPRYYPSSASSSFWPATYPIQNLLSPQSFFDDFSDFSGFGSTFRELQRETNALFKHRRHMIAEMDKIEESNCNMTTEKSTAEMKQENPHSYSFHHRSRSIIKDGHRVTESQDIENGVPNPVHIEKMNLSNGEIETSQVDSWSDEPIAFDADMPDLFIKDEPKPETPSQKLGSNADMTDLTAEDEPKQEISSQKRGGENEDSDIRTGPPKNLRDQDDESKIKYFDEKEVLLTHQLHRLAEMRSNGLLTDDEFVAAKRRILF